MEVLYVLVPVSLMLVASGVVFFIWAVRTGQFEDLEGPAHRILYDDDEEMIPEEARRDDDPEAGSRTDQNDSARGP